MAATACIGPRARGIVAWLLGVGFAKASAAEMGARVEAPPELQCDVRRELVRDRVLELEQRVVNVYNDATWEVGVGVAEALDEDKGGLLPGHGVAVLTGNPGLSDPLWTSIIVLRPKA